MREIKQYAWGRGSWLLLSALFLIGCGGGGEGNTGETPGEGPVPLTPRVQELVNQGNAAHRAADYQAALGYFTDALAEQPDHPVPQFGAVMAAMAVGDQAMVDSLSAKIQETSPELLGMLNAQGRMGAGMPGGAPHAGMGGGAGNPHAGVAMPGGAPVPPSESGMKAMEGLPEGHPTLYDVGPADSLPPDTTGVRR